MTDDVRPLRLPGHRSQPDTRPGAGWLAGTTSINSPSARWLASPAVVSGFAWDHLWLTRLVGEVDLRPVVLAFLNEVDNPEGVVLGRDCATVLGLDRDVVAEPVAVESFAGYPRAEPEGRADEHPVECRGRGREVLDDERRTGEDLAVEL